MQSQLSENEKDWNTVKNWLQGDSGFADARPLLLYTTSVNWNVKLYITSWSSSSTDGMFMIQPDREVYVTDLHWTKMCQGIFTFRVRGEQNCLRSSSSTSKSFTDSSICNIEGKLLFTIANTKQTVSLVNYCYPLTRCHATRLTATQTHFNDTYATNDRHVAWAITQYVILRPVLIREFWAMVIHKLDWWWLALSSDINTTSQNSNSPGIATSSADEYGKRSKIWIENALI